MLLTMVRRVSAQLPYNQFLFRVAPRHTKAELREYLEKVYNVKVARITTSISLGASGCSARARRGEESAARGWAILLLTLALSSFLFTGKTRRAMGKRALFHKLKDYKRALVQLQDDKTIIKAPSAPAPKLAPKQELR